jgi:hypothetical protein
MAGSKHVTRIYEGSLRSLSPEERLDLPALITRDLADQTVGMAVPPKHSIMELNGLGK